MKKHILGFGIFSFIFASFAVAFAYFYAPPIPQTVHLEQPIYQAEPQSSCQKRKKKANDLHTEVISSQYFYRENKIVSKIKLIWNGNDVAPKNISVVAKFGTSTDFTKVDGVHPQPLNSPFLRSNSAVVEVVHELGCESFDEKKNLYASYTIFNDYSDTNNSDTFISTNPTSVVFVHDKQPRGFGCGSGSGAGNGKR